MLLLGIIRKVLVSLAPLALYYLLRKIVKKQPLPKKKSHPSSFDKSTIVEGEIVEEKM
jgi:hypothetical protein